MSTNAKGSGDHSITRADEYCIHCDCTIAYKTASLGSRCGIEIYNMKNKDFPMELKWESYDKPQNDEQQTTG